MTDPKPPQAIGFYALDQKIAVVGIFVILCFAALHAAGYFFAPLLAAIVIGLLLGRVADRMERAGLSPALTAGILLLGALVSLFVILFGLIDPLSKWVDRAPLLWFKLRQIVDSFEEPLRNMVSLREEVRGVFGNSGSSAVVVSSNGQGEDVQEVVAAVPALAGQILIFVGAFYFFIAGRRDLKRSLIGIYTSRADQLRICRMIGAVEYAVSHYLAAVTAINFCFGVIVGVVMAAIGMPEPLLWGALAFGLNFIPYLGPALMAVLIFGASVVSFYDLTMPVVATLSFIGLNLLEGQFVTPSIIGRASTLNPFLVFCSLAFGLWFWGAGGAFLAVPILLIVRTVAVHSRPRARAVLAGLRPAPASGAPPRPAIADVDQTSASGRTGTG